MYGCKKCSMITGVLFLVAGVLYLLTDLGYVDWWKLQWWTVAFLLCGVSGIAMTKCPDCMAMRQGGMPKKR